MNIIRTLLRSFLFLILAICFSCEEQGLFVNCPDCTEEEPLTANLEIKLTGSISTVSLINIYEGNLEDNVIYTSFQTSRTKTEIPVTINKKYTITAAYYIDGDNYVAVDSATPRVIYNKDRCENPCYFVDDRVVDLRLKYTK